MTKDFTVHSEFNMKTLKLLFQTFEIINVYIKRYISKKMLISNNILAESQLFMLFKSLDYTAIMI